jgi:DNA-binding response OmpR family regulator
MVCNNVAGNLEDFRLEKMKFSPAVMPVTILCVHDSPRALMARSLILSLAGYDVQTATSGDAAIRLFARYEFDIVIADHFLPVINGTQLSRLMKDVRPEVQVVLLAETREMPSIADHADLILTKGMDPEVFLAAIKKLVARRRPSLVPTYKKVANSN